MWFACIGRARSDDKVSNDQDSSILILSSHIHCTSKAVPCAQTLFTKSAFPRYLDCNQDHLCSEFDAPWPHVLYRVCFSIVCLSREKTTKMREFAFLSLVSPYVLPYASVHIQRMCKSDIKGSSQPPLPASHSLPPPPAETPHSVHGATDQTPSTPLQEEKDLSTRVDTDKVQQQVGLFPALSSSLLCFLFTCASPRPCPPLLHLGILDRQRFRLTQVPFLRTPMRLYASEACTLPTAIRSWMRPRRGS